jgi:hypothetical protein
MVMIMTMVAISLVRSQPLSLFWLGSFDKIGKVSFVWESLCSLKEAF